MHQPMTDTQLKAAATEALVDELWATKKAILDLTQHFDAVQQQLRSQTKPDFRGNLTSGQHVVRVYPITVLAVKDKDALHKWALSSPRWKDFVAVNNAKIKSQMTKDKQLAGQLADLAAIQVKQVFSVVGLKDEPEDA